MALVIAGVMVLGTMNMMAFADTVGQAKVNSTITVSGLDTGDTVTYYRVLAWGPNQTPAVDGITDPTTGEYVLVNGTPTGWIWGDGVDTSKLSNDDLLQLIGTNDGTGQITGALASKIAASYGTAVASDQALTGADSWTAENQDPGLYTVIVTPASSDTIYNPIFVAANWYVDNEGPDSSNSIAIVTSERTYYDKAMAKKSKLPLEKVAQPVGTDTDSDNTVTDTNGLNDDNPTTGDVGETYEFKVTSTIPKFAANYTNPVFRLKDTLSEGLQLDTGSIKVFAEVNGAWVEMNNSYYELTPAPTTSGWTVNFKSDYLKGENMPAAGQNIKVTYLAKVTNEAKKIVNQDTNDVDLIFSTTPDDEEGHGVIRRETNHFTFSIDADLFGQGEWQDSSNEAVKVGIDKDGNPIVSTSTEYWGGTTHAPLEGAEFELWKGDGSAIYKNDNWPNGVTVKSDATGRITITGLDQGDYLLKETKAPTGYVKLQDDVPVNITAVIKTDRKVVEEVENGSDTPVEVTYETNYLESYTVTIGGATTKYTIELKTSDSEINKIDRDTTTVQSSDKELANTKGVELPSTGGMGTTLFYAIGAILVLGAGILLVSKRRMSAN